MTATKIILENAKCPICLESNFYRLHDFADEFSTYSVNTCKTCNLTLTSPRPDLATIGVYYDAQNYTPFLSTTGRTSLFGRIYTWVRYFSLEWKKNRINRLVPVGRLLDLGCGTGEFLSTMKMAGWQVAGVEPSEDASEYARRNLGLDVETNLINKNSLATQVAPFDVITMWHVLEHLHDPVSALKAIKDILTEKGYLILGLPNRENWDALLYGENWVAYDVPRHLFHFTPESLSRIMDICGMRIIKQHAIPLDTVFNMVLSEKSILAKAIWKFPISFIRIAMVLPIALLFAFVFKRGSGMLYYIAKK